MEAITQLYYQVYITYQHQLHVSTIAAVTIFRLGTIFIREAILYHIYIASLIKIVSNLNMARAVMAEICS